MDFTHQSERGLFENCQREGYKSMQTSFRDYLFGGYLAQFDVVMRKLILELQACSQCILKTSMRRVNPPIDLQDVAFA
jgi:hypothetical protein